MRKLHKAVTDLVLLSVGKPNPDDVAKPGKLKDPRFNRDPQEERRKAASKRDARLGVSSPTSPRESAPAVNSLANAHPGWNNWSARTLQSAQSVSASATNVSLPVNTPLLVVSASQGNAVNSSSYGRPVVPAPTATLTTTTSANTSTATPVPKEAKTYSPVMRQVTSKPSAPSKLSIRFTSQPESIASKSGIPAWAGPLEKLLAEGKANERSSMATSSSPKGYTVNPGNDVERPQPQAKPRSVDMDAHYKAATEASRRVTNTSITTIVGDEETQAVELESLSLAKNVSGITEVRRSCTKALCCSILTCVIASLEVSGARTAGKWPREAVGRLSAPA